MITFGTFLAGWGDLAFDLKAYSFGKYSLPTYVDVELLEIGNFYNTKELSNGRCYNHSMDIFARITCITISCLLKNDENNVELCKKINGNKIFIYCMCDRPDNDPNIV